MDFTDPKTILVVQVGKIGDMILTTPLLSGLKKIFPHSNLKVLASEINFDIPLNHSSVEEVIIYRKNLLKNIFFTERSLNEIDLWIDTKDNYSRTSEMLLRKYKPHHSLGFNFEKKVFDVSLKDHVNGVHAVDINLSPLYYLNYPKENAAELRPSFSIPSEVARKFEIDFTSGQFNLLINVSAGNESRYIENKKWIDIIGKIINIRSADISLMGLKTDVKRIDEILNHFNNGKVKYVETKNILEAAEVVRRNDMVITPDTSIVHICSAFNKPVIGLYPDVKWNLDKFRPLSDQNEIVISGDKDSIEDIEAGEVVKSFERLLEKINSGNAESRTRVRKEDH